MDIKPNKSNYEPAIRRRQTRRLIGDFSSPRKMAQTEIKEGTTVNNEDVKSTRPQPFMLDTSDIDDKQISAKSLGIKKFSFGHLRRNLSPKRIFKKGGLLVGTMVIMVVGYLGFKLYFAAQGIIDRNSGGALALNGNIDPSQLKGEGDGRVNILLIGIGGDQHQGGDLADTIIVASIDPFNKDIAMLSIPRDLWVDIPGQWSTKINAAHALGEESRFNESGYPSGGAGLLQQTVEQTLGIPVHYYVRVDFDGFKQAVDAVGGIKANIPETICDYNIAWQFGFNCINAGEQDLDSNHALFYARTRNSARGDFDRNERQRLIMLALRDKILNLGTFSNPLKISGLLDAAGNHVRTNLQISEMLRVYEIVSEIDESKIISSGLDDYVTTGNVNGASAVIPKSNDFTQIQGYVRSIFTDGFIKNEAAAIDVFNGTDTVGLASEFADNLKTYGYQIGNVTDAPSTDYVATKLYDLSNGTAPYTKNYLQKRIGTISLDQNKLPEGLKSEAKFVIIVGDDAAR